MKLEHTDTTRLFMYCLYERPRDFPGHYVLRKSFCVRGIDMVAWLSHPDDIIIEKDYRLIHEMMRRKGFHWILRKPEDDPVIMGVYI